jgi:hypothetical protein
MTRIQKSKLGFTLAAGISCALSITLWFSGSKEQGLFVAMWVPSILAFGALMTLGKEPIHE